MGGAAQDFFLKWSSKRWLARGEIMQSSPIEYSLYSFWYLHNNVEYLRMGWYIGKEAEYDGFILAFCLLGWSFNTGTMHPAYKMFSAK